MKDFQIGFEPQWTYSFDSRSSCYCLRQPIVIWRQIKQYSNLISLWKVESKNWALWYYHKTVLKQVHATGRATNFDLNCHSVYVPTSDAGHSTKGLRRHFVPSNYRQNGSKKFLAKSFNYEPGQLIIRAWVCLGGPQSKFLSPFLSWTMNNFKRRATTKNGS